MIRWLLVVQAILHAILAAEFHAVNDGGLSMIFITAAVVDAVAAWFADE